MIINLNKYHIFSYSILARHPMFSYFFGFQVYLLGVYCFPYARFNLCYFSFSFFTFNSSYFLSFFRIFIFSFTDSILSHSILGQRYSRNYSKNVRIQLSPKFFSGKFLATFLKCYPTFFARSLNSFQALRRTLTGSMVFILSDFMENSSQNCALVNFLILSIYFKCLWYGSIITGGLSSGCLLSGSSFLTCYYYLGTLSMVMSQAYFSQSSNPISQSYIATK